MRIVKGSGTILFSSTCSIYFYASWETLFKGYLGDGPGFEIRGQYGDSYRAARAWVVYANANWHSPPAKDRQVVTNKSLTAP